MTLGRSPAFHGQGASLFLISVMCSGFRAAVFLLCRVRRPARAAGEGDDPAKKTEHGADPRISENLRPISDKLDALCVVDWRAPAQSFPLPVERSITS